MNLDNIKLLALAANAAGYKIDHWHNGFEPYSRGEGYLLDDNCLWNPLVHNGDAFALALDLGISLELNASIEIGTFTHQGITEGEYERGVEAWFVDKNGNTIKSEQVYAGDKYAAARLAIVTVAAEIGKLK